MPNTIQSLPASSNKQDLIDFRFNGRLKKQRNQEGLPVVKVSAKKQGKSC